MMFDNAHFEVFNKDIAGLAGSFTVNPDSCENSNFYGEFLRYSALSDQAAGRSTTHVFIDDNQNKIMGFISLRANSILSIEDNGTILGDPALEISVLAVAQEYEGRGVGTALIDFALSEAAYLHEKHMGIKNIVLVADPKAIGFYIKNDFLEMSREAFEQHLPKENWNQNCVPMRMELSFEHYESFADLDDDEDDE